MKCKIPEISWHNRDPVLSVDIQPKTDNSTVYRLASGGTDSHVLIWSLSFTETCEVLLDVAADLTRHQRAVNVVKWSPNSELLASGDDESVIFIWKQKEESEPVHILESTNEHDKEIWITLKVLRGHMEDIYDLSWSSNSLFLVSGSVDNTAIVWDVQKGKPSSILNDHKGFVQGVAWDPRNQYIATLSTDRFLRIFDIQTKKIIHRISKCSLPVPKENELYGKKIRLYHDDTLQTFFRRLCFSPDGKLLFTPAGVLDYDGVTNILNATYIYSRHSLKQPSIVLPSPDQYTVAVKCCPILFKLREKTEPDSSAIPLPYRIIFAVATKSSLYLYDTQQKVPFGLISNIHYTRLTDIAWSNDGRIMIVSSTDGFCSLITFEEGELGEEYKDVNAFESTVLKKEKIHINNKEKENISSDQKTDTVGETRYTIEKLPAEAVIDKDIISVDEKFESPDKENRAATPIAIRRHPRGSNETPTTPTPCISKLNISVDKQCLTSTKVQNERTNNDKIAAPIRRKPRTIIPSVVERTAIVEEAMDAWPHNVNQMDQRHVTTGQTKEAQTRNVVNQIETVSGCTEDIHLVYEETVDEMESETEKFIKIGKCEKLKINVQTTPDRKTPRRVELKTISTPKTKKKLLD